MIKCEAKNIEKEQRRNSIQYIQYMRKIVHSEKGKKLS
jgi:hypothetical protein